MVKYTLAWRVFLYDADVKNKSIRVNESFAVSDVRIPATTLTIFELAKAR